MSDRFRRLQDLRSMASRGQDAGDRVVDEHSHRRWCDECEAFLTIMAREFPECLKYRGDERQKGGKVDLARLNYTDAIEWIDAQLLWMWPRSASELRSPLGY